MVTYFDRASHRLDHYDYRESGAYFITICTFRRVSMFRMDRYREIAISEWERSAALRPEVALDAFVVMPNHIHGIVWLDSVVGAQRAAPSTDRGVTRAQHAAPLLQRLPPASLGAFVRAYKSAVTREVNLARHTPGAPVWQRNCYEHVIRSDQALTGIREYIRTNPDRWAFDRENPGARPDATETTFWRNLEA